jgi:VIT1/CCC1 family predicted Fe2+/Mn2+ transporter
VAAAAKAGSKAGATAKKAADPVFKIVRVIPEKEGRRRPTNAQRNAQSRANANVKSEAAKKERIQAGYAARQASVEAEEQAKQARVIAGVRERAATTSQQRSAARAAKYQDRAISTVGVFAAPAINPILLVVFTMAALIVFYLVVTSAQEFSGFLGSIQTGLRKLSTTSPLFEAKTQ